MGLGDVGVIDTALVLALTKRKRLLNVEHVQIRPPYDRDGRHTSIDSLFLTKLTTQALNREKSELCAGSVVSAKSSSATPGAARREAFAKTK
jgi:hypothetical protein